MKYIIFIDHQGKENVMFAGDVGKGDAAYLTKTVVPKLRPLSNKAYMEGPAAILHTMAKYSYVLDGDTVYWCCEWNPGLLVIRFSPDGKMKWASFKSPHPNFGGRKASKKELAAFEGHEDDDNPQYNLIFDAWDAQFEEIDREYRKFKPATSATRKKFDAATARANKLGEKLQSLYGDDEKAYNTWMKRC
jgi:hypothetical protein